MRGIMFHVRKRIQVVTSLNPVRKRYQYMARNLNPVRKRIDSVSFLSHSSDLCRVLHRNLYHSIFDNLLDPYSFIGGY